MESDAWSEPVDPEFLSELLARYEEACSLRFSPERSQQIWNGRPHHYGETSRDQHFTHVHHPLDENDA